MAFTDFITPLSGLGGVIVGALTNAWIARRKSDSEAAGAARDDDRDDVVTIDARWQAMLDQQRSDFKALIDPLQAQVNTLTEKVGVLEGALNRVQALYRSAVLHIRELYAKWPSDRRDEMPSIPETLRDEI